MLARQCAAGSHADLQHLSARHCNPFEGPRFPLIEQQAGMQVAVSGVKDVGDGDSVPAAHLGHLGQDRGQLGPGNTPSTR